jgi:hypothetical protein
VFAQDGIDIGATASAVGQWGIVLSLLTIIVALIRIQITRTEAREVIARDDCDARVAQAIAPVAQEVLRLRRLLGVVSTVIAPTHPELAEYLRVDGIDNPTPARGVPITVVVEPPPGPGAA